VAILKAPLLSLGASQQLGKALVFFGWKGLDVVREYVIPANPRTAGQVTQRDYLTAAVAKIHFAQASTFPLIAKDVMAYALWASVVQAATTWFNQAVRNWLDQKVKVGGLGAIICFGVITPGVDKINIAVHMFEEAGVITTVDLKYGTSKTALIHTQATTRGLLMAGVDITGLTTGVKYFIQVVPSAPAGFVGVKSGIYYGVPL